MKDIRDYTLKELKALLQKKGFPGFSAQQIFGWIYQKGAGSFSEMSNLSRQARSSLSKEFSLGKLKLLKRQASKDRVEKFLFGLEDGASIETVVIPEKKRVTLCLSTQAGCKFKCSFCESGKGGFIRNLAAHEIVEQCLAVAKTISPDRISNIVFMGIGEPLDNFNNLIKAIEIFSEPKGLGLGRRRITISTCGLIPQIRQLVKLKMGIKLSVSLHSPSNAIRTRLMPINKTYPLRELIKVLRKFSDSDNYPVTFEYALIRGVNTGSKDAKSLAKLLKGIKCKLNLIPVNYSISRFLAPDESEIGNFEKELEKCGVFFTLRKSRGRDIAAACGQLRARIPGTATIIQGRPYPLRELG